MIGIVLVSHSFALAQSTMELALEMVHGQPPPIRIAAGVAGGFGTDAVAIARAIDELDETTGVIVITDLGSAQLSSALALDLRTTSHPVLISVGPFLEGTMAAVIGAGSGRPLAAVAQEANNALEAKSTFGAGGATDAVSTTIHWPTDLVSSQEVLVNPLGIHARTASALVQLVAEYNCDIRLTNLTSRRGPADASSLVELLSLGAQLNNQILIEAHGADATQAVQALQDLIRQGFSQLSPNPIRP